jgi:alanine racemase
MSVQRAKANVDPGAIAHNCARLLTALDGSALCAVVKADGYGHGAVECAAAALRAGASWLAVATLGEALQLRDAGVEAPLLIMGLLDRAELEQAITLSADIVVWTEQHIDHASAAAALVSGAARVHVKLDTGMGRLGTRDRAEASRVVAAALAAPGVRLAGVMTHFATADMPDDDGFFERQLDAFADWAREVKANTSPDVLVHAANSAALLREPRRARFDMARCGVAVYGLDPFGEDPSARGLMPALELTSCVAEVKRCRAGESTGYGRCFIATRDTRIGVLPIGYGDGWRRSLSNNADVLIDRRRYPLVGTVSMDNVAVDLGPDPAVLGLRNAEAVLIGARGSERVTAEELARRIGTINYEITCGLSARVERTHHSRVRVATPAQ